MLKHDDLTQDVKAKARKRGSDAKHALRAEAEDATAQLGNEAANRIERTANAAEAAAREFGGDSLLARAAHQFADQVEGIAARLRTAELTTITRDVSQFARKNPAMFIGGAALLGFAATRFLKARDPQPVDDGRSHDDPWSTKTYQHSAARGYDVPS